MHFSFSRILLLSLALLGQGQVNGSEIPVNLSATIQTVLPSVVKVKIQRVDVPEDESSDIISFDGGGSGFVLDDKHHIMTNAHVIKDARKIVVIDNNQYEYPALLVGKDDKTDIAILEAPTFNAPPLKSGKSSDLSIGEGLFVIGSPFSLSHSVSYGIVSMTGRYLSNYPYIPFIQTDAAINPGNSGGAVFNLKGELIAMASTFYSRQGNYTNIGFAIPSDSFLRIGEKLIRDKKIKRGYMGAELILSEKISRKSGIPIGLFVSRVMPGSPAAQAGLKAGDLIVRANDLSLRNGGELHRILENSNPGDTLTLVIARNKTNLTLTLEEEPEEVKPLITNAGTNDLSEKMGLIISEEPNGIKVLVTYAGAKTVGIDPGDLIAQVNGKTVKTIKEINGQLAKLKENEIAQLTIMRGEETIALPIGSKSALKLFSTLN